MKTSDVVRRIVAPVLILLGISNLAFSYWSAEYVKVDDYNTCSNEAFPPNEPDREPLPQLTVVYHPLIIGAECDWLLADGTHYRENIREFWGGYVLVGLVTAMTIGGAGWLVGGEIRSAFLRRKS
jgi:hypothetical protein